MGIALTTTLLVARFEGLPSHATTFNSGQAGLFARLLSL